MARTISDDILNILDTCKVDGNVVRLTCEQLERKTYEQVNKVLDALGGKWNRKEKGHVFEDSPAERLESAIMTGEYNHWKQDFGFFETPLPLAKRVAELAEIEHDSYTILEPSAGRGALFKPIEQYLQNYRLIEIQEKNCDYLRETHGPVGCADFLAISPDTLGTYDRVIMNPPFAKQADIDHVLHAWKFVKSGGRLVSIMSAGVAFRQNRKTHEFRELMQRYGRFEMNQDDAFKSSGTMVRTIIVVMDKN